MHFGTSLFYGDAIRIKNNRYTRLQTTDDTLQQQICHAGE